MNLCVVVPSQMPHYFLAEPCALMMPFMLGRGVWVRLLMLEAREVSGERDTIPLCHVV
jgi:hypothetical protein